jgi:hypothetical protein
VDADVYLKGNKGTRGGAIDAIGSSLAITDGSYFQDNVATDSSGGAIWMAYSILRMSDSTCINNAAAWCESIHVLESLLRVADPWVIRTLLWICTVRH